MEALTIISNLHFISDKPEDIEQACLGGADWVQLRVKDVTAEELQVKAFDALQICRRFGAKLIVNDHVAIAKAIGADGVHLGKTDMSPAEARSVLGQEFIIGGTANTFSDVQRLQKAGVDYIGLGPFRFTTTKKNLSPILGLEGYRKILDQIKSEGIRIPVVAIGGIDVGDLDALFMTGISGVAVSSSISSKSDKLGATLSFLDTIKRIKHA